MNKKIQERTARAGLTPIRVKVYIIIAFIFLSLIGALIYQYRQNSNIKNEIEIDKTEKAVEVTKEEVQQWNNQIEAHNDEFFKGQRSIIGDIKNTIKNSKTIKLPDYEKVKVNTTNTDAMLDTLLIAQPD